MTEKANNKLTLAQKIAAIPEDVLTFFYYACSMSVALLAIVTIVFTIYNERIVLKVEKIVSNFDRNNDIELANNLNIINNLLRKNYVYTFTKFTVILIVILSSILWIIVLINEILNSKNNIITLFLLLSTVLVLTSVIGIPLILFLLNKNRYVKLKNCKFNFKSLYSFVSKYKVFTEIEFINKVISPKLSFYLNDNLDIELGINHLLNVDGLKIILELRNNGNNPCIIIFEYPNEKEYTFKLVNKDNKSISNIGEGIFEVLSTYEHNTIHFFRGNKLIGSLDLKKNSITTNIIEFTPSNTNIKSVSNNTLNFMKKKNMNLVLLNNEDNLKYKLIRKN